MSYTRSPKTTSLRRPDRVHSAAWCILGALILGIAAVGGAQQLAADYSWQPHFASGDVEVVGAANCVPQTIACNSTVSGRLTTGDCTSPAFPGIFADGYQFAGVAGMTVTVNASSSAFDIAAALGDPSYDFAGDPLQVDVFDDNSGPGNDARFMHTLDETGTWTVGVLNAAPNFTGDPGSYTVQLECDGTVDNTPLAPSQLRATPISTTAIELSWMDNSDNEDEFEVQIAETGSAFRTLSVDPPNSTGGIAMDLTPATTYDFRVRARNAAGNSAWSNQDSATTFNEATEPCVPDETTLCLQGGRFRTQVTWRDFNNNKGPGTIVPFGSDDSGLIWFFDADNWEMLLKVLDGCQFNDHFWVFAAATTNVEYTLRVTDTQTGLVQEYFNPLGVAAPAITDTEAFATCP